MKKVVKIVLKSLLWLVLTLIVLAAGLIGYRMVKNNQGKKAANEKLVDKVPSLQLGGVLVRDLNKNGSVEPYEDPQVPTGERVSDLLSRMTIEEKAGMMMHPFLFPNPDSSFFSIGLLTGLTPEEVIVNRNIRHITSSLGGSDPKVHARWQNKIQRLAARSRLGIPLSVSSDPRHSIKSGAAVAMSGLSQWPDPLGFAAARDSALVATFAKIAAKEYRAIGIHTALHPMADLATEPRWARISGTFGSDAQLSSTLTSAYIKGFQGDSVNYESVTCMTKHFSGGGPQKDGWDAHFKYGKEQVYPGNNFDYHLLPFKAAVKAGTARMMPYYGIPVGQTSEDVGFAFNKEIITGMLREKLGYEGVVCTDWGVISSISILGFTVVEAKDHGVADLSPKEKVLKALKAGVDQFGGEYVPHYIVELVKEGKISEQRIDKSVARMLELKFRQGLFEDPYVDVEKAGEICKKPSYQKAGRKAMAASTVLLKNGYGDEPLLPFDKNTKIYAEGMEKEAFSDYGEIVDDVAAADVAVLALNAPYEPRSGFLESIFHQGRLHYTKEKLDHILEVAAARPTVVSIYMDRPAVIPKINKKAGAVLAHFGTSDKVMADILFGKAAPGGKLPFELPSSPEAVKNQKEDLPHDSKQPLYPYGHGLGYSTE